MSGDVVPPEGSAACQDVASSILRASAYGALVIEGWVGIGCIWHFPSVSKFVVPESPPSGSVDLHFEGPGHCGSCPEVVTGLWEDFGEGVQPHGGIGSCEVFLGCV